MRTQLLVVGAGPYAVAAAAHARARGIGTHVVGHPMSFWRGQMPDEMYLRSGPGWHLDPTGEHTFEAFFEDRGLDPAEHDPIPISVFLDHTDWFLAQKGLEIDGRLVAGLTHPDGHFVAVLEDGEEIEAERVLACPGVGHFTNLPEWAGRVPPDLRSHTSERVTFDDLAGARVAVIGGRQSAYEWAALLCDHGAARVDLVHRHATPRFERVSWAFCDPYVEQTVAVRGWWRTLTPVAREQIIREFWEVGRLTLEHWLVPRLDPTVVTSHPRTAVEAVDGHGPVALGLSDGTTLVVDHVVLASGYVADLDRVPWLGGVRDQVSVTDGFPDLTAGFETSLPGLYLTGFAATRDFGPFYGFTKGCASSAQLVVEEMLR